MRARVAKEIVIENALLNQFSPTFSKAYLENELDWNQSSDQNSGNKAPEKPFKLQINYFLSQQGVQPIQDMGALPMFEAEDIEDAEISTD